MRAAAEDIRRTGSREGDLLGDRYELESVIASGGMGQVWRARDTVLDRPVAVKVLSGQLTTDPTFVTRFRYEARHAGRLGDPNIAAIHDYGEGTDGDGEELAYLVMELVEGETLSKLLRRTPRLDPATALDVVRQTASALAAAHAAGVVHRDVKPANVLVRPDGVVKLTDFGIAWSSANVPLTRAGQVMGSVHYLAPERLDGDRATPASDVYSLGAIAYECLAGRRAVEGDNSVTTAFKHARETPPPLPDDVPADVRALVERAMARQPADRFADGAALRDAVDALPAAAIPDRHPTVVLAAEDVDGATVALDPGRRRSRIVPAVVAVAVLAVIAVVVGSALLLSPDAPATDAAPAPVPATSTSADPAVVTAVVLSADGLVGSTVAEVRSQLIARGLQVQLRPAESADAPAGQVLALDPLGELAPGQLVTVTYAVAPAPAPTTAPPAPQTTEAPAAEPSAVDTPEQDDDGRGGGRGHGNRGGRGDD
ncbi:protein kinase [Geodermatophilus sp. SYSU D00691]